MISNETRYVCLCKAGLFLVFFLRISIKAEFSTDANSLKSKQNVENKTSSRTSRNNDNIVHIIQG